MGGKVKSKGELFINSRIVEQPVGYYTCCKRLGEGTCIIREIVNHQ